MTAGTLNLKTLDAPVFSLTADVDWASDYAIRDFLTLVSGYGIKPTVFATHPSVALTEFFSKGAIDLGIHPNFLPGSSHGNDVSSVIARMCADFPEARTFRSHCFFDHTHVTREMFQRGYRYDSNLCLYLQPYLVPLFHQSGLVRFPVFWEDDVHWLRTDGEWTLDRYWTEFMSPGLKILNFHPFFVTANVPNQDYYVKIKSHITTLGADTIDTIRYAKAGVRPFLIQLLDRLVGRGERFYSLEDLYQMQAFNAPARPSIGSGTRAQDGRGEAG